jgi:hypothetical protein
LLWSCSGGDSGEELNPPPEEENQAPGTPELVYPSDNLLCLENTLDFQWNPAIDADGDTITYLLEISTDNQFSQIDYTASGAAAIQTLSLEKNTAYYWRVKATDAHNAESNYSSVFSFYTEGEAVTNHLPFAPMLVNPLPGSPAAQGTLTLEWTANDTDNDPLTFDIYFGTDNPPATLVSENQDTTTFSATAAAATTYYWKVVVKDDKGGQTIGQVWHFNTN